MATASIDLPDGTKVKIEGSPEEINKVLELYGQQPVRASPRRVNSETGITRRGQTERSGSGAMDQIRVLIQEGFFGTKRSLKDVQKRLEELGRIYPQSHLSTPLRRMVVGRELRRLRENKNWIYVNR